MLRNLTIAALVALPLATATAEDAPPPTATPHACDDPVVECVDIFTSVFSRDAVLRRARERVGPLDFFGGQEPTCEEVARARKELLRGGDAGEAPACE